MHDIPEGIHEESGSINISYTLAWRFVAFVVNIVAIMTSNDSYPLLSKYMQCSVNKASLFAHYHLKCLVLICTFDVLILLQCTTLI